MSKEMINAIPKVAVLLSTYNGERFLKEQLDSVLIQEGVDVTIFVRDDGSTDHTVDLLKQYSDQIKLFQEDNIGVGNSFMELVYKAGCEYDYYSFCDQDDVWLKEKLQKAILNLKQEDVPMLYCSNQELIDEEGNKIGMRFAEPINTSYLQVLNDNKLTGCTMVWNRFLQEIMVEEKRRPGTELLHKRIHDVWVGMVASVTGRIIYDDESYIKYRQHGDNVVGADGISAVSGWKKKLKNPQLRNGRSSLAKEILDKYSDLIKEDTVKLSLENYAFYRSERECRKLLLKDSISDYSGESKLSIKAKILLRLI